MAHGDEYTDDYTDKELYDYTVTIMKNISQYYTKNDFGKDTDIDKAIEYDVSKKLANVMPSRYIEAEISVLNLQDKKAIITTFSTEDCITLVAIHEEVAGTTISHGKYDPKELKEDFYIRYHGTEGKNTKVEAVPTSKGIDELSDLEYFRHKVTEGLKLPRNMILDTIKPPTDWTSATFKTSAVVEDSKPTIDFTKISQLTPPSTNGLPRYESGMHVGIDLSKVKVVEDEGNLMAKEMAAIIDKQILEDLTKAAADLAYKAPKWNVPTFGWTEEKTNWDAISWKSTYGRYPLTPNPFGGVLTTDCTPPVWCDPKPAAMEEISFTEAELDELIDLFDKCESQVMKFA